MKHKSYRIILMFAALLFAVASCNDDDNTPSKSSDSDVIASVSQTLKMQNSVNDVALNSKESLAGFSLVKTFHQDSCPKVIYDINSLDSLILDFGVDSCEWYNGQYFSGRIILVLDTTMMGEVEIIFENFCSQDFCLNGEYSLDFGDSDFSMDFEDQVFTDEDGNEYTYSADFSYSLLSDGGTPDDFSDDQYEITGSSSGMDSEGNAFTFEIVSALLLDLGCETPEVTSGIAVFRMEGQSDVTVDYGDGTCDQEVVVTVDGVEKAVNM